MEKPVVFRNEGEQIVGMLHSPEKAGGEAPAVVMFHGFTGTKVEPHRLFVKTARRLAGEGFYVLRFDFRGSGDSEGDFKEMTLEGEISDAKASLDFILSQLGVDPERVGVIGLSMGGGVAACLAGRDERVKAVAMWAAASEDPPNLFRELIRTFEERPDKSADYVDMGGNLVGRGFFEDLRNFKPLREISGFEGPVLIVHGDNDQTVSVEHAYRFYERLKGKHPLTALHIVRGADHTFNSHGWEREVIEVTADFMKRALSCRA